MFLKIDKKANDARDANRKLGIWAIGMVLVALLIASADATLNFLAPEKHEALGYIAASLGVFGTCIGLWGFHKSSPRWSWLRNRLLAESLRLFHFHYIAARLPEIVEATRDAERERRYLEARMIVFDSLRSKLIDLPVKALAHYIEAPQDVSFDHFVTPAPETAKAGGCAEISPAATDALGSWKELRLDWQFAYCEAKLTNAAGGGWLTPRRLDRHFILIGWACIALIVGLHVLHFAEPWLHFSRAILQLAVVWTALIALAVRALESGLQPQREVERYEQYRSHIRVTSNRFNAAKGFSAKLEIARGFEGVSLEEMQIFIRTHARSYFIL
jgi:hypothetical protein